jgi:glutaredoxin
MKSLALIVALMMVIAPATAGKLYKWVDKDGRVHYTDQLPPPEAKTTERKQLGDKASDAPVVPYALQQAAKNFPVTLYTADQCGDACSQASALLGQRGVPFTERNARDPAAAEELKALIGGKLEVPVMKLGSQVVRGYEESTWNTALDAAGYPKWAVSPTRAATTPTKPAKPGANPAEPAAQMSVTEPARQ